MTHYIIEDGPYKKAFDAMPANCRVPFIANGLIGNKKVKKSKSASIKYVCPICGAELRGKDGLNVKCCDCNEFMLPVHK